jgi:hypothetical protein
VSNPVSSFNLNNTFLVFFDKINNETVSKIRAEYAV